MTPGNIPTNPQEESQEVEIGPWTEVCQGPLRCARCHSKHAVLFFHMFAHLIFTIRGRSKAEPRCMLQESTLPLISWPGVLRQFRNSGHVSSEPTATGHTGQHDSFSTVTFSFHAPFGTSQMNRYFLTGDTDGSLIPMGTELHGGCSLTSPPCAGIRPRAPCKGLGCFS